MCADRTRVRSRRATIACLITSTLLAAAWTAGATPPDTTTSTDRYARVSPSRDGIGKVYLGREISFVMGHRGAAWLERPEREIEERPDRVVDGMRLDPADVVVDLGAGSGYFTFRLARRVPDGRVLAVDIQPEMLERLARGAAERGLDNVEPVPGAVDDPGLAPDSVDAVLMVDAYHEFEFPYEMMTAVVRALRPGGRVFLVEYRAEDPDVPILPLHKMTASQARREMEAVGLEFVANETFLPTQHFLVFRKPAGVPAADEAASPRPRHDGPPSRGPAAPRPSSTGR
jgi:ubiquinone/menaquinone biosynthesis C-methylase UbiE